MAPLSELVAELNRLILAGQTLEAMEQFYADDVTMQENEAAPRVGKVVCLEHEQRMLAGVSATEAMLHRQAINEATGTVFSEWSYRFTDLTGKRFRLTEVSVQYWQNERILNEKFYYGKVLTEL
jgi:hypothetical protein